MQFHPTKPRNTSPQGDAQRVLTSTAPAPARTPKSAAPPHSPRDATKQTASSDPPDSGTLGIRRNTSTHDTSDETGRARAANLRPQSPIPAASADDETPQGPPPSTRPVHAYINIWCTPRPRRAAASPPKPEAQSSPTTGPEHPSSQKPSKQKNPKYKAAAPPAAEET